MLTLTLTQYCKRPIFVVTRSRTTKRPGVIELQIEEIKSTLSVTTIADFHSCCFLKTSVDYVAVVNEL